MRPLRFFIATAALCLLAPRASHSQSQAAALPQLAPERQWNLDLNFLGLGAGFAVRSSDRTSVGIAIGAGGNWFNYMVLGGRHFADSKGFSYQTKDGATDKALFEMFHATVFVRRHFEDGRHLDVGVKASGFLHSDSSDDDFGGGTFVGVQATGIWYKWRRIGFGSEVNVGRYSEGRPELGVNVAPILMRVTFP